MANLLPDQVVSAVYRTTHVTDPISSLIASFDEWIKLDRRRYQDGNEDESQLSHFDEVVDAWYQEYFLVVLWYYWISFVYRTLFGFYRKVRIKTLSSKTLRSGDLTERAQIVAAPGSRI